MSPLPQAVYDGRTDAARLLLECGCDKEAKTMYFGQTPLHLAALQGRLDASRLLLEAGAKPDARDRGDQTPADLATRAGNHALVAILTAALNRGSPA